MSTINDIFVDSSVLIEYFKGSNCELLDHLGSSPNYNLFINDIVISEVIYHMVAHSSGASPMTLKRKSLLKAKVDSIDFETLFMQFFHISTRVRSISAITSLMSEFNLLSNDAIILNCCVENEIQYLATFDADFTAPSTHFGISAISSIEQLKTKRT